MTEEPLQRISGRISILAIPLTVTLPCSRTERRNSRAKQQESRQDKAQSAVVVLKSMNLVNNEREDRGDISSIENPLLAMNP
jgi:hypothetical protein